MKPCIICREYKEEKEFNKEHIIPESIGVSLTIEDVCKTCNNRLGKIDKLLIDNLLIRLYAIRRQILNKKGNSQVLFPELVNPEYPRTKCIIQRDSTGKIKYKPTLSISRKKTDPNNFTITGVDPNKSPEQQLKHIKNLFKKKYDHNLTEEEKSNIIHSLKHIHILLRIPHFLLKRKWILKN